MKEEFLKKYKNLEGEGESEGEGKRTYIYHQTPAIILSYPHTATLTTAPSLPHPQDFCTS